MAVSSTLIFPSTNILQQMYICKSIWPRQMKVHSLPFSSFISPDLIAVHFIVSNIILTSLLYYGSGKDFLIWPILKCVARKPIENVYNWLLIGLWCLQGISSISENILSSKIQEWCWIIRFVLKKIPDTEYFPPKPTTYRDIENI